MGLGNYTQSNEKRRLSGLIVKRGSQTGISVIAAVLFGLPFVGMGTFVTLVGLKIAPADPKNVHAPYWVLTACGLMFGVSGLALWSLAWKQYQTNRRKALAQKNHANEPALVDYSWDPRGYSTHSWLNVAKGIVGLGFFAIFLLPFNGWAWFVSGPWLVKIIVSLFDLILILACGYTLMFIGRAYKFGASRIEFARFPYRVTEPVSIRWLTPSGINRAMNGTFTLRCVKEWTESSGGMHGRSQTTIHEEQWNGTWSLSYPEDFAPGKIVAFEFTPPADAPTTCLSAEQPVFWEFEVKLSLPGLDFAETYLVPVY